MRPDVERLLEHLRSVERDVSQDSGAFTLFALVERNDLNDRWDLVVSAPWLRPSREGILTITRAMARHLDAGELILIARVVPVPSESDYVRDVFSHMLRDNLVVAGGYTLLDWPHVLSGEDEAAPDDWMGRSYILTPRKAEMAHSAAA